MSSLFKSNHFSDFLFLIIRTNFFSVKYKFLTLSLFLCFFVVIFFYSVNATAQTISDIANENEDGSVRIIEPKKEVPVAESAAIDTENFELGLFTGYLAVEDFNTNVIYGASFSYHITPAIMAQINYGTSEVDRASFEKNAGSGFDFVGNRDFEYYNLLVGYRVLRGRSFLGRNKKYNSDIYLLAGAGSVDFSVGSNTSFVIGTSYRVVLTDYLVANMDFRGHFVDQELPGSNNSTFNTEFLIGLNLLF